MLRAAKSVADQRTANRFCSLLFLQPLVQHDIQFTCNRRNGKMTWDYYMMSFISYTSSRCECKKRKPAKWIRVSYVNENILEFTYTMSACWNAYSVCVRWVQLPDTSVSVDFYLIICIDSSLYYNCSLHALRCVKPFNDMNAFVPC